MSSKTVAVLTCLSKTFDCIDHNLIIAKLDAQRFEKRLLEFIQRIKVDSAFSSWEIIFSVVPQELILGLHLFNIYICDIFLQTPRNIDFAGYADDNISYTYSSKIGHVLTNLQVLKKNYFTDLLHINW